MLKVLTVAVVNFHLRQLVGLEKRQSFVITTHSMDNIQNNLLILKSHKCEVADFSFGSYSKAELVALTL